MKLNIRLSEASFEYTIMPLFNCNYFEQIFIRKWYVENGVSIKSESELILLSKEYRIFHLFIYLFVVYNSINEN